MIQQSSCQNARQPKKSPFATARLVRQTVTLKWYHLSSGLQPSISETTYLQAEKHLVCVHRM
jgi:hypothetical protein